MVSSGLSYRGGKMLERAVDYISLTVWWLAKFNLQSMDVGGENDEIGVIRFSFTPIKDQSHLTILSTQHQKAANVGVVYKENHLTKCNT